MQEISAGDRRFNAGRVYSSVSDAFFGIEVEIMRGSYGLRFYLNVFSRPVPAYEGKSDRALVNILTDDDAASFVCHRSEGGQRLLLTEEPARKMLGMLKEGKSFSIVIPGSSYREKVEVSNFTQVFEKLKKIRIKAQEPVKSVSQKFQIKPRVVSKTPASIPVIVT